MLRSRPHPPVAQYAPFPGARHLPPFPPNPATRSTRRGRADLYRVDRSGENLTRLTRDGGENTYPAWGPYPE